jgi:L-amino acid N-acyltransferase YncA
MAENQRSTAHNLESAGALLIAEAVEEILPLIKRIAADEPMRFSMIAAAAAITDGQGTTRIADAITGESQCGERLINLRAARPDDDAMLWLWRNELSTRAHSRTTAPVIWPVHQAWWKRATESADQRFLIAEADGRAVGMLRFGKVGAGEFEVSINLAPWARGLGLGERILDQGCRTFRAQIGPSPLVASIHRGNSASRRIFERVGFARVEGQCGSSFERYELLEGMA